MKKKRKGNRFPFLFLSGFNGPGPSAATLAIIKHTILLNWEPMRRRVGKASDLGKVNDLGKASDFGKVSDLEKAMYLSLSATVTT